MRALLVVLALGASAGAALAVTAPPSPNGPAMYSPGYQEPIVLPPGPPVQLPSAAAGGPSVVPDAQDVASREQIRAARQAYSRACGAYRSTEFCECMGAGMSQSVAPADLQLAARTVASRALSWNAPMTEPMALSGQSVPKLERQLAAACER